jgi:hypothetical protein
MSVQRTVVMVRGDRVEDVHYVSGQGTVTLTDESGYSLEGETARRVGPNEDPSAVARYWFKQRYSGFKKPIDYPEIGFA